MIAPTNLPELVEAVAELVGYLEVELEAELEAASPSAARGAENVVVLGRARARASGRARAAQVEGWLSDARQAQVCLAGIDLTNNRHPPAPEDPPPPLRIA